MPKPAMSKIYISLLKEAYVQQTKHSNSRRRLLLAQIDELNTRLRNAREMVADQKIGLDDFREIKLDCMNKITALEASLRARQTTQRV